MTRKRIRRGFTLIETMVAISLLTIAIVAPMTLTAQSLASAYYARDQITAFYLAQEAIEAVRSIRDGQILQIAESSNASPINIFGPIPLNSQPFTIDAREADPSQAITVCSGGVCPPLQTDGTLYGYDPSWTATNFTRTVTAHFVKNPDGSDDQNEVRLTVTITWQEGAIVTPRSFSISENLYRWVNDGSGSTS
jgi:prepilin-type N-terminal cleavage/methylation domain-containing protein